MGKEKGSLKEKKLLYWYFRNMQLANWTRNTLHSCNRHGLVFARLNSQRSGSIIPISKAIPVCRVHSHFVTANVFEMERAGVVFMLLTACN
jgi:hypothetical protein